MHVCLLTVDGLRTAYEGPVPYRRDGLYLLHKEGHYALGHSPLALLWKDAACSRYFVDTDAAGTALAQQERNHPQSAAIYEALRCGSRRIAPNVEYRPSPVTLRLAQHTAMCMSQQQERWKLAVL